MSMFFFKKTVDQMDQREQRSEIALECYLSAIVAMQEHAIEIAPEITKDHQIVLRTFHRNLFEDLSVEALEKSLATLAGILEDYKAKAAAFQAQRGEDLRSMLVNLAVAAETMSAHNDLHSTHLKEFTEQLQATTRGTYLGQIKRDLTRHVSDLRSSDMSMCQENNGSVSAMEARFNEFQDRLEQAERRATTDALTGLLNRGEGEVRLRRQIDRGGATSIMLIDLNGFKQINDQWGHLCGDQVLKVFSRNLEQLVRPSDVVCRWGGDEFLVFLRNDDVIAHERAQELCGMLRSTYKIMTLGKIFEVEISASVGVAQAREGESVDDLLARADNDMYRKKRRNKEVHCVLAEACPTI